MRDMWTYREEMWLTTDLNGFKVEALDGEIGSVDEKTNEVGSSYLVVDTGPWIFGKKVLLPAGTVRAIDREAGQVYVDRSREEIRNAPEHDPSGYAEQEYRLALADYYARFY